MYSLTKYSEIGNKDNSMGTEKSHYTKQKIHINFRPLFLLMLGVVMGIFIAADFPTWLHMVTVLCVVCAVTLSFISKYKTGLVLAVGIIMGMTRLFISAPTIDEPPSGEHDISGSIYIYENGSLILNDLKIDGKSTDGKLLIRSANGEFEIDSIFKFHADIIKTTDAESLSYKNYLLSEDIHYFTEFKNIEAYNVDSGKTTLHGIFMFIRDSIEKNIHNVFDDGDADIINGIVLGKRTEQNSDMQVMRKMGIAHIFALSGLHISILLGVFDRLLYRLGIVKRRIIACGFLVFYCGIVGFPASLVRATVMFMVSHMMFVIKMRYDELSTCSLSALLILLFNPYQLFSLGFLLSFTAILGIILISEPIKSIFESLMTKKIASVLAVSIAASLSVFPVICIYFGSIPTFGVNINIVAIPIVTVMLVLALPAIFLGAVFKPLSVPFAFAVKMLIKVITLLSKAMSELPFSTLKIEKVTFVSAFFYYLALYFSSKFVIVERKYKIIITICLLVTSILFILV